MNITQAIEQLQAFGEIHGFHTPLVLKAEVEGCGILETRTIRIGLKENDGYSNEIAIQSMDF